MSASLPGCRPLRGAAGSALFSRQLDLGSAGTSAGPPGPARVRSRRTARRRSSAGAAPERPHTAAAGPADAPPGADWKRPPASPGNVGRRAGRGGPARVHRRGTAPRRGTVPGRAAGAHGPAAARAARCKCDRSTRGRQCRGGRRNGCTRSRQPLAARQAAARVRRLPLTARRARLAARPRRQPAPAQPRRDPRIVEPLFRCTLQRRAARAVGAAGPRRLTARTAQPGSPAPFVAAGVRFLPSQSAVAGSGDSGQPGGRPYQAPAMQDLSEAGAFDFAGGPHTFSAPVAVARGAARQRAGPRQCPPTWRPAVPLRRPPRRRTARGRPVHQHARPA